MVLYLGHADRRRRVRPAPQIEPTDLDKPPVTLPLSQ
jgi:hypothetical protein